MPKFSPSLLQVQLKSPAVNGSRFPNVRIESTELSDGSKLLEFHPLAEGKERQTVMAFNEFILEMAQLQSSHDTLPNNGTRSDDHFEENFNAWATAEFCTRIERSIGVIGKALDTYGIDNCAFSFNGGKDCTVLLHLILLAAWRGNHLISADRPLDTIYILPSNAFSQVADFCVDTAKRHHLNLISYKYPMKSGLAAFKKDYPHIKAIFIGIRKSDPFGSSQSHMTRTSDGWPDYMRVNPILEWDYSDVWTFLRGANLRFCSLYSCGYTSIGSTDDTIPNPALRDPSCRCGFKAARYLSGTGNEAERNGRISFDR
eukprot:Partr_v1_DN25166_c0_g1_i1_m76809 putative FAD1 flavin adenine dinucleotide synthetase homolog (S. cerevisiae)